MLKRYCLFLFLIFGLFSSCNTDFEVNDKWKEIHIVYGLLNLDDSAQVIKITKAYQNEQTSAIEVAGIQDSLYLDTLVVTLKNLSTHVVTELNQIYLENKDTGIFAAPGQYLYATDTLFKLDPNAVYELKVVNPKTGVTSSATALVVNPIFAAYPSEGGSFSFIHNIQAPRIDFTSGKNAKFYEVTLLINIRETNTETGVVTEKVLRWPIIESQVLPSTQGGHNVIFNMKGDRFFDFLKNQLEINPKITRQLPSIGFEAWGGGEELFNYREVTKPSIGVVQKNTDYTNIQNGFGIFSSRYRTYFENPLSSKTYSELMTFPDVKDLNFVP